MVGRQELFEKFGEVRSVFASALNSGDIDRERDAFLSRFGTETLSAGLPYIDAIKGLDAETSTAGVRWLQDVVDEYCARVRAVVPSLGIFR